MPSDSALVADLIAAVGGEPGRGVVLSARTDRLVVRVGGIVVKAHAHGTEEGALRARVLAAAHPLVSELMVPPLSTAAGAGALVASVRGRLVTAWPYGEALNPEDPDAAPWARAAILLARLHAVRPADVGALPAAGGPDRLARAMDALRAVRSGPAGRAVEAAFAGLPPAASATAPSLVHGDWHFGQLVRTPGWDWRLVDVDDLGVGDPAWDLGRPAAWFAAGLLGPSEWDAFLGAYRTAGGPGVPASGEVWTRLDAPARWLAVQSAAQAVVAADRAGRPLDEVDHALVDACRRMAGTPAAAG